MFPRSLDGTRNVFVLWLNEPSYFPTGIHIFYFASILCLKSISGQHNLFFNTELQYLKSYQRKCMEHLIK